MNALALAPAHTISAAKLTCSCVVLCCAQASVLRMLHGAGQSAIQVHWAVDGASLHSLLFGQRHTAACVLEVVVASQHVGRWPRTRGFNLPRQRMPTTSAMSLRAVIIRALRTGYFGEFSLRSLYFSLAARQCFLEADALQLGATCSKLGRPAR